MVKQIISVIECGMGYVKAVYLIGLPHGGTKSIKTALYKHDVYKVRFCLAQKLICIFFYHMILMPFLHIRIKCKVGLDH